MSGAVDYLETHLDLCNTVSEPHARQSQQIIQGHYLNIFCENQDSPHRFVLKSVQSVSLSLGKVSSPILYSAIHSTKPALTIQASIVAYSIYPLTYPLPLH